MGRAVAVALGSGGWPGFGCRGGDRPGPRAGCSQPGWCQSDPGAAAAGLVVGATGETPAGDSAHAQSRLAGLDRISDGGTEPVVAAGDPGGLEPRSLDERLGLADPALSDPCHGAAGTDAGVDAVVAVAQERHVMNGPVTRRELLLGAAALGLAACGRGGSPADGLNLWTLQLAPKFNPYFDDVLTAWRQRQPKWPVRWTDLPWGSVERKLLAAVYARTAPDVVNLNPPFAANLASKGGLSDLSPLLPSGAAERYLPSVWDACRDPEAGQIAIPWYLTVRLSLVNRRLLDEAGLDSQYIGEVKIYDDIATIDLPDGMPKDVFTHLKEVRVCGQALNIEEASAPRSAPKARGPHRGDRGGMRGERNFYAHS